MASSSEGDVLNISIIFDDDDTDNETSCFPTTDHNNKLCCFVNK
jgi:hypothetical protein